VRKAKVDTSEFAKRDRGTFQGKQRRGIAVPPKKITQVFFRRTGGGGGGGGGVAPRPLGGMVFVTRAGFLAGFSAATLTTKIDKPRSHPRATYRVRSAGARGMHVRTHLLFPQKFSGRGNFINTLIELVGFSNECVPCVERKLSGTTFPTRCWIGSKFLSKSSALKPG